MTKAIVLLCVVAFIASLSFSAACPSFAAELSSKEIKRIEKAIDKVKNEAMGIQKKGYREVKESGPATIPYLIDVLKDKSVNRKSRALTCDLLGEFKAKQAASVLIYTLKNTSHTVRAAACKALGRIADPEAVAPLLSLLDDDTFEVRKSATEALISFDDKRIPPKVAKLLNDENDYVRIAAITLLNDKVDPKTAKAIREALEKNRVPDVRRIAAEALGGLKDTHSVALLSEAITEDTNAAVREACAVALGKIGDESATPALIEALKDEYKDVQLRAAYSLKDLTGENFGRDYAKWSNWHRSSSAVK
jgi:HEAT repeat protein